MLQLINITKSFGAANPVLKDLNLEINSGEFCVLLGSNGSGKSTLMRCISGEYTPDSGSILINGIDMTPQSRSILVGTVIQDINQSTIPELSILENMVLGHNANRPASLRFYKSLRADMLKLLQNFPGHKLEQYIDQPLRNLSGGQRQMLATLMVMLSEPQILLLDEHTSALDPQMQQLLMDYTVQNIRARKLTTIMITHKLSDALNYGDRLVMLDRGKISLDVSGSQKAALSKAELEALYAS